MAELEVVQEEIFASALSIVGGALAFAEIEVEEGPDGEPRPVMPPAWADVYGPAESRKRFRAACAALLPSKECPVGVTVARDVLLGIIRARSTANNVPRSLNILVNMTAPDDDSMLPEFGEIIDEKGVLVE